MEIQILIRDTAVGFQLMSHSCVHLPLDLVFWREVLIRAVGMVGAKKFKIKKRRARGKKRWEKSIDSSPALVCCRIVLLLYRSSSNRFTKRKRVTCFTGRRGQLACIRHQSQTAGNIITVAHREHPKSALREFLRSTKNREGGQAPLASQLLLPIERALH